eukprot:TRINITY_DN235_c3_g4_i1.p1 TRINITY_DN235_c3_g4~~TRINITY_DN235_c3_g4_i1.p1  ORF type:complete len:106 (-),score=5.61 TRINITY_DN235_c3_g4_i1:260-577(-)
MTCFSPSFSESKGKGRVRQRAAHRVSRSNRKISSLIPDAEMTQHSLPSKFQLRGWVAPFGFRATRNPDPSRRCSGSQQVPSNIEMQAKIFGSVVTLDCINVQVAC